MLKTGSIAEAVEALNTLEQEYEALRTEGHDLRVRMREVDERCCDLSMVEIPAARAELIESAKAG